MSLSTLSDAMRRRRLIRDHSDALRTNDALAQASRDLRRKAQAYLNEGRPDLAQPYIDEALVFEAAMSRPSGL